jgi:TrkA domain protein
MVQSNQNVEDPRQATPMAQQWHDLMFTVEDLPGIGRRYDMQGQHGGRVSVVIHRRSGQRELYAYGADDRDQDAPACVIRLSDAQARSLGSILGGAFFKPAAVEELETVISDLTIDWLTVPEGSPVAGRPIRASAIRQSTGMTIMAIVRHHRVLTAPVGDDVIEANDQVVVAGPQEGLARLAQMMSPAQRS